MELQGVGGRVQGVEMQGTARSVKGIDERVLELEAENARLKSLVGELLVTNQLLREGKGQGTGIRK
ncbi:MAG TPA: hypothetical protein VMD58_00265 [Acidobacteriaceae bacterium]|nr:hypothetical protein [Acidobacteriaceae bacterium]